MTDDPTQPHAIDLALFLTDVKAGGHTAGKSVWNGLKWLQDTLGFVEWPLDSFLLKAPTTTEAARPQKTMADALPLKVWRHFRLIAEAGQGALGLFASLSLYIAVTSLRFRHAQRHAFQHDKCSRRTLLGFISKGKTRGQAAFWVAAPTYVAPGEPLFWDM